MGPVSCKVFSVGSVETKFCVDCRKEKCNFVFLTDRKKTGHKVRIVTARYLNESVYEICGRGSPRAINTYDGTRELQGSE
jgi:hypothetical protein